MTEVTKTRASAALLQSLVSLLSPSEQPSTNDGSNGSEQAAPLNTQLLERVSELLYNAQKEGLTPLTRDDILAHVGFLYDVLSTLSRHQRNATSERDSVKTNLEKIQEEFTALNPTTVSSITTTSNSVEIFKKDTGRPSLSNSPLKASVAIQTRRRSVNAFALDQKEAQRHVKNFTTDAQSHVPASSAGIKEGGFFGGYGSVPQQPRRDPRPSKRRKLSGSPAAQITGVVDINTQTQREQIESCLKIFNCDQGTQIRGIFTQASFNEFIRLWECYIAHGNIAPISSQLSLDSDPPNVLPAFKAASSDLQNLRILEAKQESPLRNYYTRLQWMKLSESVETIRQALKHNNGLAEAYREAMQNPSDSIIISAAGICEYLLKVSCAQYDNRDVRLQSSNCIENFVNKIQEGWSDHILVKVFGLGILPLMRSSGAQTKIRYTSILEPVAQAVRNSCFNVHRLCSIIEERYMEIIKFGRQPLLKDPRVDSELMSVYRATLSETAKMCGATDTAANIINSQLKEAPRPCQKMDLQSHSFPRRTASINAEMAAKAFLDSNIDIIAPAQPRSQGQDPRMPHPIQSTTAEKQVPKAPVAMLQYSQSLKEISNGNPFNPKHAPRKALYPSQPPSMPSSMRAEMTQAPELSSTRRPPHPTLSTSPQMIFGATSTNASPSKASENIRPASAMAPQMNPNRTIQTKSTHQVSCRMLENVRPMLAIAPQLLPTRMSSTKNKSPSKFGMIIPEKRRPCYGAPFVGDRNHQRLPLPRMMTPSPQKGDLQTGNNESPSERSRDERRSRM